MEPINLFYNYSQVMNSIVLLDGKIRENHLFTIKGVPLVKYSYLNDVDRCNELIEFIQYRKAYIDTALSVLENSFNIDFKFFNTYGPSQSLILIYNYINLKPQTSNSRNTPITAWVTLDNIN